MKLDRTKVTRLIELMNSTTNGKMPAHEAIVDCFDMGMDEQTLDFLIAVGTDIHTRDELKTIYDRMYPDKADGWDEFWAGIMEMSFLFPTPDHKAYVLASIFPGWIECTVSGPLTEKRRKILNRFMDFWNTLYLMNRSPMREQLMAPSIAAAAQGKANMTTYVSRGSREISLNQPLTSEHQVHTGGEVFKLLERHRDEIAVMNCFCRQYKQMNGGEKCGIGMPIEACVSMGAISSQLVESGIARRLSYDEACQLMESFEKNGCVHTAFHYGHNVENEELVICNCCTDCCLLYGGYQKGSLSKILVKAFYTPEMIDETRCTGCNLCGKYCPTSATYYDSDEGRLVFDYAKCVGCGQCVNQCAFDVRAMVPDERSVFVKSKEPANA